MLYIVGLGLGDERGVTVRELDAVRRCARVYMEAYTALLVLGPDPPSRLDNLVRAFSIRAADRLFAQKPALTQAVAHSLPRRVLPAGEAVREGDHGRRQGDGGGGATRPGSARGRRRRHCLPRRRAPVRVKDCLIFFSFLMNDEVAV